MSLLGKAAVAMWWQMAADQRDEFLDWHTHEHLPERLSIQGFRRGSRWASADDATGFFVMYELEERATLTGDAYMTRLNNPTPWSVKMMPHHKQMVRSLTDVTCSAGGGMAGHALTLRLSPQEGRDAKLRSWFSQTLPQIAQQRGISGAHLLETQAAGAAPMTQEQRIRGGDGAADWVVLVTGHVMSALREIQQGQLSAACLSEQGAESDVTSGVYSLSSSLAAGEV